MTATYQYDALGRVTQASESGGVVKQYTYDIGNNRLSFTSQKNSQTVNNTSYTYDNQSRLKTVSENGTLQATYTYNVNGAREKLAYSNGASENYQYNLANWLTNLENRNQSGLISSYAYTYNLDGNQKTKTDNSGRVTTYAYDGAGRLLSESESTGLGLSYLYDSSGNRAVMTAMGTESYTVEYEYDANNRLLSDTKAEGSVVTTTNYGYDSNGNQISKNSETLTPAGTDPEELGLDQEGGAFLYEYDGFNRLVSVETDGEIVSYTYRPDGLRNSKLVAGIETVHLWDGQNIAADTVSGGITAVYVRGIGLLMSDGAGGKAYYLYNGHGDVVQLTDANGAAVWYYDYDAFGNEREITRQRQCKNAEKRQLNFVGFQR